MVRYFITYAVNMSQDTVNYGNISLQLDNTIATHEDIEQITDIIAESRDIARDRIIVLYWRRYDSPL